MINRLRRSLPGRFLETCVRGFFDAQIAASASQLAYSLLFTLFPFLMFLNALLGVLPIDLDDVLSVTSQVIPTEAKSVIETYLDYLSGMSTPGLLWTGCALTAMALFRIVSTLMEAMHRIYHVEKRRHPVRQTLTAVGGAALLMVSFILVLLVFLLGQGTLDALGRVCTIPGGFVHVWLALRFVVLAAWVFVMLLLLYTVSPNRPLRLSEAVPGALISMIGWIAASLGLSFYIDRFTRYSLLYGSIGAVIVLLLWLYATGILLQLGGLVNETLSRLRSEAGADSLYREEV